MASTVVTTSFGVPLSDNKNSLSAGANGPLLLSDTVLVDKLAAFGRQRIPERVVHAKGAGAHGFFEVTHDVTDITKASLFSCIGKRSPVLARFSTVGGEKGSADAARDPRGFAIKHYTADGNWDMVGNNTPVFFIRDPIRFPDFIAAVAKRNPATNCPDPNAFWDFLATVPESFHQVMILFSDRGTPLSYRHMNGYSSHALRFVNKEGVSNFVKLHYKTEAGIKNFSGPEAGGICGSDPDHATRDLYEQISKGGEAAWRLFFQVMPEADVAHYRFNPFDVTKVWSQSDYPLRPVGRLVLNRNPENYFAEVEQAAFSPGNMVPGIESSPDKMLQGRMFSYPDSHRHRLGANFNQLPVNCPFATRVRNQQRDGPMCFTHQGSAPTYFTGLAATGGAQGVDSTVAEFPVAVSGATGRFDQTPADALIDYVQVGESAYGDIIQLLFPVRKHATHHLMQPRELYRRVLTDDGRASLISNLAAHMTGARRDVQSRALVHWYRIDLDLGRRLEAALASLASTRPVREITEGGSSSSVS